MKSTTSNIASNIERQVMAGVGAVYLARQLTGTTALKIYAVILSVWGIGRLVWVSKVFDNFFAVESHGFGAISNFALAALEHAHVGVQLLLVVTVAAAASLAIDAARSLSLLSHHTHMA